MSTAPVTPKLTVDTVAVCLHEGKLKVILIERKNAPFGWALPGGFVDVGERLEAAAIRELFEETNCKTNYITFFDMYDKPDRDPRGHNISAVFIGHFNFNDNTLKAKDDAKNLQLFELNDLPVLAFDHGQIIEDVKASLKLTNEELWVLYSLEK